MKSKGTPKGKKTRQRIIDASIDLIRLKGIDNVTLNDICAASEIAQGTFYHHFKSIDDILLEIIRREGEEISALSSSRSDLQSMTRLKNLLETLFSYYDRKGKDIVAQLYRLDLKPESGMSVLEENLPVRPLIKEIIEQGQEKGEFNQIQSSGFYCSLITSQIIFQSFLWIQDSSNRTFSQIAGERMRPLLKMLQI